MNDKLYRVKLLVPQNVIKETLSRMGIPDIKNKKLYQTCHLVCMFGDYYVAHFKQLFRYITKNGQAGFGNVSLEDLNRRDSIVYCLLKWNMIELLETNVNLNHNVRIFVVPFAEKQKWTIIKKINADNITGVV